MKYFKSTLFIFLILSFSCYAGIGTFKYKWIRIEPPFKTDFSDIIFDNNGNGYLIGGYIFKIVGDKIETFNPAPPTLTINKLFARDNRLWVTHENFSYESTLYFYDGKTWSEINNPLANHIMFLKVNEDNTIWLGGDREFAYFTGKEWLFYNYPSIKGAVFWITANSNSDFLMYDGSGYVYKYYNGKYSVIQEKANCYFETASKEIFTFSEGNVYKIKNDKPVFHSSLGKEVVAYSMFATDEKNIWITSEKGNLYHWNGMGWTHTKLPTEEILRKIYFYKNEGWICANNGVLFHFAPAEDEKQISVYTGFTKKRVLSINTPHNNEYGVAVGDFNNDGYKDIVTAKLLASNRLYINGLAKANMLYDVVFTEQSFERGMITKDESTKERAGLFIGVNVADIDNDNNEDIYFSNLMGKNKLYRNSGSGFFEDISDEPDRGIDVDQRSNTTIFGDVDNDGDLDLFVANEEGSNKLFSNDGTGHFKDITSQAGLTTAGSGMNAAFADIDNDNDLDLCVVNWAAQNKIYRNVSSNGVVKFIEITNESGTTNNGYEKNNSVVFADIDNDGDLDLFITKRKNPNRLFINNGSGVFADKTEEMFGLDTLHSYGAVIADFDNDGYQDIYVAGIGGSKFYKNFNGKKFEDVTGKYNANVNGYGTGAAYGDFDNDGDLDIYSAVYIEGESEILLNNTNNKNYLVLDVEGTKSCRDAVGVKIWFYKAGHINDKKFLLGFREISGGSGYCSASTKQVHFGTGEEKFIDVVVYFPVSGIIKEIKNISAGTKLSVVEEESLAGLMTLFLKSSGRFLSDSTTHIMFFQLLVLIVVTVLSVNWGRRRYKLSKSTLFAIHIFGLLLFVFQILMVDKKSLLTFVFLPVVSIISLLIIVHLVYERIILVRISAIEQQKVRRRIARDLHDELASNLSSAQIYTDVLQRKQEKGDELLKKISVLIKDSSESVADIIWNISPKNDSVENLFLKFKTMSVDLASAVRLKISIVEEIENKTMILPDQLRRNIFLIYKESFNNMLKYSTANKCKIELIEKGKEIKITLEDNGRGIGCKTFEAKTFDELIEAIGHVQGNGLKNLFSRAEEINASLRFICKENKGTKLEFILKMT